MKRDLPPYWTTQLAAIIIVFSVGVALFPVGWIAYRWPSYTYYWEPDYTYNGSFEANLTVASPTANVSVGYCDAIEVYDWRQDKAVRVTLRVYNDTHYLFGMIPSFGGETPRFPASVKLHFTTVQNYTVQVDRETEDTFFQCDIYAYVYMPTYLPIVTVPVYAYSFFGMGAFLVLFGLVLTSNFIRRTKQSYWAD